MEINEAKRIRIIRAMLGINSKDFAKRLNVCSATLTSWEKGRSEPQGESKRILAELCREQGIGFSPNGMPFPAADCVAFRNCDSLSS